MIDLLTMTRYAKTVVDERLKPDAAGGRDMMTMHIRAGLTRSELLAEVLVEMYAVLHWAVRPRPRSTR